MKREPAGQDDDLGRDKGRGAPGDLAKQRHGDAGEDIAVGRAAMIEDQVSGARHVLRLGLVAHELERVIGLDGAADIKSAAGIERPAAFVGLLLAQIAGNGLLGLIVDLAREVIHEDVFRGDGAIRLQFIDPVPIRLLFGQQLVAGAPDGAGQF